MKTRVIMQIVVIVLLCLITTSCAKPNIQGTWISSNGVMELVITADTMKFGINKSNPLFNSSQDAQLMNLYDTVKKIKNPLNILLYLVIKLTFLD